MSLHIGRRLGRRSDPPRSRMRAATALAAAMLIVMTVGAVPARAVGQPPVAHAQNDSTAVGRPLDIFLDATDAEDDPLTFAVVSGPTHGTLDVCSSGSCTYTPTGGYVGPDSFTWKANDGTSNSNVATYSITVVPNQPPVAVDQSDTTSVPLNIFLDATDAESDPLTFTVVSGPAHGTLTSCSSGVCTYTPTAGFLGPDSFTWKANDGTSNSNVATYSITVVPNQPPVANDQSIRVPAGTPRPITLDASDPEFDLLTFTVVSGPAHGTLTSCLSGSCTYTPTGGYVGPDSFTWKANDGTSDSNVATLSITVKQVWTALQIAQSIASPSAVVTGASFTAVPPDNFPNGVYSSSLNGFPVDGSAFGILTSGDVDSVDRPGTFADTDDGGSNVRGNTDKDVSI